MTLKSLCLTLVATHFENVLSARRGWHAVCIKARGRTCSQHNTGDTKNSRTLLKMDTLVMWLLLASLLSSTAGFTEEDMKEAMLQKLGLTELPRIQKRDLESIVVPTHIKNKYLSMVKLHNKRRRRSVPSLAGILRGVHGSAGRLTHHAYQAVLLCHYLL